MTKLNVLLLLAAASFPSLVQAQSTDVYGDRRFLGAVDRTNATSDRPRQLNSLPSTCSTVGDTVSLQATYSGGNAPYQSTYVCNGTHYVPNGQQMRPLGGLATHGTYAAFPVTVLPAGENDIFTCPALKICIAQAAPNAFNTGESTIYSTGTVTLTNGSATVTGSGTTFSSGMVGGIFASGTQSYFVTAFNSTTSITLNAAWTPITASGAAYMISYGTVIATAQVKHLGVYTSIIAPSNPMVPGASVLQGPLQSGTYSGLPLNAGDSFSVLTTAAGLIVRGGMLVFDAVSSGITPLWNYGLPIGYTTIYTCPPGKIAIIGAVTNIGDAATTAATQLIILGTGPMWGFPEIVPVGQTPSLKYLSGNNANSTGLANGKSNMTSMSILNAGDSLVVYLDGATSDAGKSVFYGVVKEAYIEN